MGNAALDAGDADQFTGRNRIGAASAPHLAVEHDLAHPGNAANGFEAAADTMQGAANSFSAVVGRLQSRGITVNVEVTEQASEVNA